MTASAPRVGEIQARLNRVTYIQTKGGKYADLDAAVYRSQSDVAYLLAALADRDEKLAKAWDRGMQFAATLPNGDELVASFSKDNPYRAAVANGGEG